MLSDFIFHPQKRRTREVPPGSDTNKNMTRYQQSDEAETEDSLDENVVIHVVPETRSKFRLTLKHCTQN